MQVLETMQYRQLETRLPGSIVAPEVHAPGVLVANDLDSKRVNNVPPGKLLLENTVTSGEGDKLRVGASVFPSD